MATRGDIRDAFYDRLVTQSSGTYDVVDASGNVIDTVTVDSQNVDLIQVEPEETLPQVVYDDNYSRVVYNGAGAGPDYKTYEADGTTVKEEIWREYIEAQFTVYVRASREDVKEPIYENVRSAFAQYAFGPWPETDLHADVIDVRVEEAASVDVGDVEDVIRGDQFEVYVTFHRDYPLTDDTIQQINSTVEVYI